MSEPATTSPPSPTGSVEAERVLATAAVLFRLGAFVLAAEVFVTEGPRQPLDSVAVVLTVQTALFALVGWRTAVPRRGWFLLDILVLTAALGLTSGQFGSGGQSVLYGFGIVGCVVVGLPDWPLWTVVGLASLPALVTVGSAVIPEHSTYPFWIAVPDALGLIGSPLVAWVIARLVRRLAAARDRQQALALVRAQELARERERGRQSDALRVRLLSTLEELAAADAVADPVVAEQLHREIEWLRGVVTRGLPESGTALFAALRAMVADRRGLRVDLSLPEVEPVLTATEVEALVGAAGEALTNVGKHAGTDQVEVSVTVMGETVAIRVADHGRGYDQSRIGPGTGQSGSIQARMVLAGGAATVESSPGRGTVVTLRIGSSSAEPINGRTARRVDGS